MREPSAIRRLNAKLLMILLAAVPVGGLMIHSLHVFQIRRQAGAFLREAERAEQAGKPQEAIGFLHAYLLLVPQDTPELARLGALLFKEKEFHESQAVFGQVVLRNPANENCRRRVVDASIHLQRYQDAQYHLEHLLKSHPQDAQLWFQLGSCQQGLGQFAQAVDSFRRAIASGPGLIAAYEKEAQLLADRLGDSREAVAVLERMVSEKENVANSDAYVARARFLQSHADSALVKEAILGSQKSNVERASDKAAELLRNAVAADVKQALRLAPLNSRALLLAAQAALANGAAGKASEFAERASREDGSNADCYLLLAASKLREKQVEKAAELLTRGLRATGGAPPLLWTLANLRIETRQIQEARSLIKRLSVIEAARPIVQYLSARILITESKWAKAARQLEGVAADLAPWPQMHTDSQVWLAQCDTRLGRDDLAVGAYRVALDIDPEWTPARIGLAETLRRLGRIDEAIVELRRLEHRADAPPRLSETLLRLNICKTLASPPDARHWTEIDAELNRILKQQSAAGAALLKAEVQLGKGKLDEAAQILRAALATEPNEIRLWGTLTSLMARRERWDETERLLNEIRKRRGDSVLFRVARADYLVRRYGGACKDELRSLANPPPTASPSDRLRLAISMGRLACAAQDYDGARRQWRAVADAQPDDLWIRSMLIDLARQAGRTEDMAPLLAEMQAIEQNGPFTLYGQALHSASLAERMNKDVKREKDKGRLAEADVLFEQALQRLDEARSRFPGWSKILLLAAEIADFRGQQEAAVENYCAAFDLGERSSAVVNKLLGLLVERQDNAKIKTIVRQLILENVPFSTELTSLVSQALVQAGDRQGALELARQSAERSADFRTAIVLGLLLRVNDKPAEAEAEFRRATRLAPKDVSAWLFLMSFYSSTGKKDLVDKTMKETLTKIDRQQAWVVQGYAAQLVGRRQDAEKTYDAALTKMPDRFDIRRLAIETKLENHRTAEAELLLHEFLASPAAAISSANVAWARRALAAALADAGTFPKYVRALALVDQNLRDSPASDRDLCARALIQASFPTLAGRKQALQTLARLAGRPSMTPNDRIVLARLYLSRGEWVVASKIFRDVVARSKEPRHLSAYVDALLTHKELADAGDWLTRLESLVPRDFATTDLRARLLAGQNRYAEAFDRIVAALNEKTGESSSKAARRRRAARRLEQLGDELTRRKRDGEARRFFGEAEALLVAPGGRPAGPSVEHLQFLVRRRRGKEALEEFEQLCARPPAAEVDQACMVCASLRVDDRQLLSRLQRSLARVAKQRLTYAAWVALATLQDRMGQFDDEEASYRRALALDPGTRVDALNNLANLLALRKKDLSEAQSLVAKAIALAGPRSALLDSRGVVELAAGQPDAALADFDTAVEDAARPTYLFHQARGLMRKGQRANARSSLKQALERGLAEESLNSLEVADLRQLKAQLGDVSPSPSRSESGPVESAEIVTLTCAAWSESAGESDSGQYLDKTASTPSGVSSNAPQVSQMFCVDLLHDTNNGQPYQVAFTPMAGFLNGVPEINCLDPNCDETRVATANAKLVVDEATFRRIAINDYAGAFPLASGDALGNNGKTFGPFEHRTVADKTVMDHTVMDHRVMDDTVTDNASAVLPLASGFLAEASLASDMNGWTVKSDAPPPASDTHGQNVLVASAPSTLTLGLVALACVVLAWVALACVVLGDDWRRRRLASADQSSPANTMTAKYDGRQIR